MVAHARNPIDPVTGQRAQSIEPADPAREADYDLGQRDPGQIKSDIDRTRAHMDETLDSLGERLRPRNLLDELMSMLPWGASSTLQSAASGLIRDAARATAWSTWRQARRHPIPATMIGAGLAWLAIEYSRGNGRSSPSAERDAGEGSHSQGLWGSARVKAQQASHAAGDMASSAASNVTHAASAAGHAVTSSVSSAAQSVSQTAAQTGHRIADSARKVGDTVATGLSTTGHALAEGASAASHALRQSASHATAAVKDRTAAVTHTIEDQYHRSRTAAREAWDASPLAVGAAVLGAGLAAGLLLPRTRVEDQTMGESAQHLRERARQAGQQALEGGKKVGLATAHAVVDEVDRQGLTAQTLMDSAIYIVKESGRAAREAAEHAAEEKGLSPQQVQDKAKALADQAAQTAKETTVEQARQVTEGLTT